MDIGRWPYEETSFELRDAARGRFVIRTPWVLSEIEVQPGSQNFRTLSSFADSAGHMTPEFVASISEILGHLGSLPVSYTLARAHQDFGVDTHAKIVDLPLDHPSSLTESLKVPGRESLPGQWSWDLEAALQLAALPDGRYDPMTLLSIARRFHYLDCSDNKIDEVYRKVRAMADGPARRDACARIVRQNHYVTEKCQQSLAPAMDRAASMKATLAGFMSEEEGHDRLLAGSLKALGHEPATCAPTPAVQALMALLESAAARNFLAFAMAIDFFERPQFRDDDALGALLCSVGDASAARALEIHKSINDGGEHEAFSVKLLEAMKSVDETYASQAFRMAELVSAAIAQVPHDLEHALFNA